MNHSTLFRWGLRAALAAVAAAFSACTVYEDGYYGGPPPVGGAYVEGGYVDNGYVDSGYAQSGYYYGDRYYQDEWYDDYYDYHPPVYRSYVTYSAAWPYYYGGRYYSYRWWNDNRYRDYCHDHGSNHRRYSKRRSGDELKLVRYHGPDRGRLPSGYHSEKWYKDRGYSLKTNTYRDRDGDLRGRQPSSSRNSRDDDDRPSSQHPRALKQPDKYRYTGSANRESDKSRNSSRSSQNDRSRTSSSEHKKSNSSSNRSSGRDDRPSSQHPRALKQPEKYHYTGSGGGGNRSQSDRSDRNQKSGDRGDRSGGHGGDKGDKDGKSKGKKN